MLTPSQRDLSLREGRTLPTHDLTEPDITDLNAYLDEKRGALKARQARIEDGSLGAQRIAARVSAEGRSGIRRIRIREFQTITDSPPDVAGYDLGPSSPELQLGVLGSCLTHSFLIQAALLKVPVDTLEVEVAGQIDARATHPAHKDIPVFPHDLSYVVHIASPASSDEIDKLGAAVEQNCPILNLLKKPQLITARIDHQRSGSGAPSFSRSREKVHVLE